MNADIIYLGSELVDRIYLGSDQVWPQEAPDDNLLVNGTFDVDASGWSLRNGAAVEVRNGELVLTKSTGSNPFIFQTVQLVAGKTYEFKGRVTEAANPTASFRIGTSAGNLNVINSGGFGVNSWTQNYTSPSDQLVYYSVVHSSGVIGSFIVVDNLSVREI